MLPDRVSNPGPLTYESGALPIALRGPALKMYVQLMLYTTFLPNISSDSGEKVDFSGFAIFSNSRHF